MAKSHREIAQSLREPIPEPRHKTRPVASWRGLKPHDHIRKRASDDRRVWVVEGVAAGGATICTADGAFGLLTNTKWRLDWERVPRARLKRAATDSPP
jgi:hypothetical protein